MHLCSTDDYEINIARVRMRESMGGHGVPEDKIKSRYEKALNLIPDLVEICDIVHIYDNTNVPFRIFKKRKDVIIIGRINIGVIQILKNSLE